MKIGGEFNGFDISAQGLAVQRKKMNLIAENIANVDSVRTEDGKPYQRKFLKIVQNQNNFFADPVEGNKIRLVSTKSDHITVTGENVQLKKSAANLSSSELTDNKQGDLIYMPENPAADKDGYVEMPNVNIITEMTEMIAATRSYEANLTALNSSKQIAKDSLEI